jgi:hypothetical protein
MIFQTGGALDVKPVSLSCKMLLQTTASYSGCQKILQRQTLSWDCPFNTQKSKTFILGIKALENMNRAYYTLKLMLLLDKRRFLSGPPIHIQVPHARCQNRLKKSADLQRTQAGRTIVCRG